MKRTGPTNPILGALVATLHKEAAVNNAPVWHRVADDLAAPTRQRRIVNISTLARCVAPKESVVVPGKVLGAGSIPHAITIAAWAFSTGARTAIENAKGKCLTIPELLKTNPTGKNIRLIG